jgi:hypothetical protein
MGYVSGAGKKKQSYEETAMTNTYINLKSKGPQDNPLPNKEAFDTVGHIFEGRIKGWQSNVLLLVLSDDEDGDAQFTVISDYDGSGNIYYHNELDPDVYKPISKINIEIAEYYEAK